MRTFQYSDARSHKFWNIDLKGKSFTVTYGKVGTAGQSQTKTFPDEARATKEHDKLVAEKLRKGYRETTPSAGSSLREALEAAILDNPKDRASYAALADYLGEQGDPRGEFIQVQLALEEEGRSPAERRKLKAREKALLKAHEEEWVGKWAKLARPSGPDHGQVDLPAPRPYRFVRGVLADVAIGRLTLRCARAFVRAAQTRLVQRLYVGNFAYSDLEAEYEEEYEEEELIDESSEPGPDLPDPEGEEYPSQFVLLRWPHFASLRVFQLGWGSDESYGDHTHFRCFVPGDHAFDFVKQMPRLEELYLFAHCVDAKKLFALPLPHLRVLQLYHNHRQYPLDKLANNASLGQLTHLLCHPGALYGGERRAYIRLPHLRAVAHSPLLKRLTHLRLRLADFGDKGIEEIVDSGALKRLQVLDLRHGRVSDAGARMLAACPDVKNLELLDLSRNELTKEGIAALRATGVRLEVGYQHRPSAEEDYPVYLYEGDPE